MVGSGAPVEGDAVGGSEPRLLVPCLDGELVLEAVAMAVAAEGECGTGAKKRFISLSISLTLSTKYRCVFRKMSM